MKIKKKKGLILMTKQAFKLKKMIERRAHIAKLEGAEEFTVMFNDESIKIVLEEVLISILQQGYSVEFLYDPILFCDDPHGSYQVTVKINQY